MNQHPPRQRTRLLLFVILGVGLGLLACIARTDLNDTPPQGWWAARGPVVPHDDFPADCRLCHVGEDWHTIAEDFTFDHAAQTGVALSGAHTQAECLRCHNDRGPVAVFAARGCAGCHEDVHLGQLGTDCGACHEERDWRAREEIVRHEQTRFPLVGAHAAVACRRCHPGGEVGAFTPVEAECIGCHLADLARAVSPDHAAMGFSSSCDECHIPTTWGGAGFIHSWPLTGAHRTLVCDACHTDGGYGGVSSDCYSCHAQEYNEASDPNHVVDNFPTNCELCHGTSTWDGASFNHSWVTGACVDCHLDDYMATTDPDHQALGFALTCQDCHDTSGWDGATFDHSGTIGECAACHLDDYLATNDPDHQAVGFPTTCEDCHGTNTWSGATFDHDFPIDSGKHRDFDCTDCHLNPSDFSSFSCTHCHDHRESAMNSEHDRVQDYVWESSACYACHPNGRE